MIDAGTEGFSAAGFVSNERRRWPGSAPETLEHRRGEIPLAEARDDGHDGFALVFRARGDTCGGADIGPIMQLGVPGMGLNVDGTRYFWYHHSEADTLDKLDPHEVALCVATMAIMAYIVADLPEPLPRAPVAPR